MIELLHGTGLWAGIYVARITIALAIGIALARLFPWNAAARHRVLVLSGLAVAGLPIVDLVLELLGGPSWASRSLPAPSPPSVGGPAAMESPLAASVVGVLALAWLSGFAVRVLRIVKSAQLLRELVDRSTPGLGSPALEKLGRSIARELRLRQDVEFRVSADCTNPAVVGIRRVSVILPRSLVADGPREALRPVLIHELAHVARRDHIALWAQQIAAAVLWFHPLIHVLNRQLSQAREEICDNHVLARIDPVAYGRTLLGVAELHSARPLRASLGLLGDRWSLEERVAQLLDRRRSTATRARRAVSMASGAVALAAAGALGIWRSPTDELDATASPAGARWDRVLEIERELLRLATVGEAQRRTELLEEFHRLQPLANPER